MAAIPICLTILEKFNAGKGAYAIVTGSTDGIGLEFAKQLASKGFNIILAARNKEKLETVRSEIEKTYSAVIVKTVTIDFSEQNKEQWDTLATVIKSTDIGVLVNNVGVSHAMPVYFAETSVHEMESILNVNIQSVLKITQLVIPGMIERKRGLILNMGSIAGLVPTPLLATYSGSKSFLCTWSQALGEELQRKNITVSLVNTYFVVSAMSKIRKATLVAPLPAAFVKSVLAKIGRPAGGRSRPFTSTPYWSHAIVEWGISVIGINKLLLKYNHGLHIDIRKRALKKQDRLEKSQ